MKSERGLGLIAVVLGGAIAVSIQPAIAQVIPDTTLPTNSAVTLKNNDFTITGGTQVGGNLFHSFQQFSIPTNGSAFFNNASAVQNIISRVTGFSPSNIDGVIGSNGKANVFLINPNGILFGQNASLNIGGSFVATTANALQFGNNGSFSASNPTAPSPLLTINPSAFLFNQIKAAPIQSNAQGLNVGDGQSLVFLGGDVILDNSFLGVANVAGGRAELGGLASSGKVDLAIEGGIFRLGFPTDVLRGDVTLKNGSTVDVSAAEGGSLAVHARSLIVAGGSSLVAGIGPGLGTVNSQAGDITIDASGIVAINQSSFITNKVYGNATGNSGNIHIIARDLSLSGGSGIGAATFGHGNAGDVNIQAQDTVYINGGGGIEAGNSGSNNLGVTVEKGAVGNGGRLTIETGSLFAVNGARLSASTAGMGNAGNIFIQARDAISFDQSFAFSAVDPEAVGNGGSIKIIANSIALKDGSEFTTSTFGQGAAGSVTLNVNSLQISSGGNVQTKTLNYREAGSIFINARDSIILSDPGSGIFASTSPGSSGNGGSIMIDPRTVTLQNEAAISVNSQGSGQGGDITIQANQVTLSDRSLITAETASNQGGNITLNMEDILLMRHNSKISTTAGTEQSGGNGGKITITAPNGFLVTAPDENNDITANAFNGSGGKVTINAHGIYWFTPLSREQLISRLTAAGIDTSNPINLNPIHLPTTNAITAVSQDNPNLNGTVTLNTPDIDPSRGLVPLPTSLVDRSNQIAQKCTPRARKNNNSFVNIGRGGIPEDPRKPLTNAPIIAPWVTLEGNERSTSQATPQNIDRTSEPTNEPIIQAQSWIKDAKGDIYLVAQPATTAPQNSASMSTPCPAP